MIIVSAPIMVACSCESHFQGAVTFFSIHFAKLDVLYKRLVLGEEQRKHPDSDTRGVHIQMVEAEGKDKPR